MINNYHITLNINTQYLQHRLLGSLILFAPYAFVPQCQNKLDNRLRLWSSFIDLQIPLLVMKFYYPVLHSSIYFFFKICSKVKL